MKNVQIDYVPRWAMYMEEARWLDSIKAKAAKVVLRSLLLFVHVLSCPADVPLLPGCLPTACVVSVRIE